MLLEEREREEKMGKVVCQTEGERGLFYERANFLSGAPRRRRKKERGSVKGWRMDLVCVS